ncbi:cryptococcal mannosyltransferase 1-domain-containing protein [Aspergillus pseudoustus]|uniref:Cryptococcal mannosyltransferase 1-domain-containing protein n=1 Tax=Aspergillus pseudoustus TaxID=1810923 RepID=A0ABR4KNN5_9EURO
MPIPMRVLETCESILDGLSFLALTALRHLSRFHKLRRRLLQFLILTFVLWSTIDVILVRRHFNEEQTHLDYKPPERQRIFIASVIRNNERSLPDGWNEAVVELANVFGSDNIFVSVYETGSSDATKNALRELDKSLETNKIGRRVITSDTGPHDEPSRDHNSGRPPYIPQLRNKSLEPLYDLRGAGAFFDRILFLGSVAFTTQDVLSLLNTNYGTYTAACSFDPLNFSALDGLFALRDTDGYEPVMQKWPFFRSSRSRDDMKSMLPVRVRSCWDEMVFMATEAFYSSLGIQFRGVPDGLAEFRLEASECCLIHADNILSGRRGVYLNPFVRVGQDAPRNPAAHPLSSWFSTWEIFESVWENRLRRWFSFPNMARWPLRRRLSRWESEDDNHKERGDFCLIKAVQPPAT